MNKAKKQLISHEHNKEILSYENSTRFNCEDLQIKYRDPYEDHPETCRIDKELYDESANDKYQGLYYAFFMGKNPAFQAGCLAGIMSIRGLIF